ncbi:MAG: hypothetical protein VX642_09135 [Bdellovibrionota bacterium]|nr:hypothetical protein [Bdellovibrionota bacterium]
MNTKKIAPFLLRLSLAASFISAVADRLGLWGTNNEAGVVWGNMQAFLEYTHYLNFWMSRSVSDALGYIATVAELILAILLILGYNLRLTALFSFLLLSSFATSMILSGGFKGPLDYSVFTAATAALLLFSLQEKRSKYDYS